MCHAFKHIAALLKSPASLYVILRYLTYGLQFVNSILLVNVLGEYSYGIYGFILMFTLYFIYLNLGVNDSLNAEYAINKDNLSVRNDLWNNAISLSICWYSFIIVGSLILLFEYPDILIKYEFIGYGVLLILACVAHNFSIFYATLYRIYGKTLKVNIEQILPQIGILILIIGGKSIASITSIVIVILSANVISLILYIHNPPEKFSFSLNIKVIKLLLSRGVSLLLYNLSFQLLTMLALMFVSAIFSVEQMGCYSLANSITNGVLMAGGAFLFIFFPKIINKMGQSKENGKRLIEKFKDIYIVFIDFISIVSIICVWGLSFAYPAYGTTLLKLYIFLIVGRIINNSCIGFSTYLISVKKEKLLVICGISSILLSVMGYALVKTLDLGIINVPQVIVVASFLFSSLVICIGQKELYGSLKLPLFLSLLLGQGKWVIFLSAIIYSYLSDSYIVLLGGLLLYLILNYKKLYYSLKNGYVIVANRSSLQF